MTYRIICFFLLLCLCSCATSFDKRGRYHQVRSGESIWGIARAYRVDVQELAEFNNVFDPNDVQPGTRLYIPEREKKPAFKQLPFGDSSGSFSKKKGGGQWDKNKDDAYTKPIKTYRGKFIWPLEGRLTSKFGIRNGRRHDGIDIDADQGTPFRASAKGKVVFSDKMRGYGNVILVRHEDNFISVYAHNHKNKVKKGDSVKQGQNIGTVGRTGRASGTHLHFEIRDGQTARNPLFFLPERKGT